MPDRFPVDICVTTEQQGNPLLPAFGTRGVFSRVPFKRKQRNTTPFLGYPQTSTTRGIEFLDPRSDCQDAVTESQLPLKQIAQSSLPPASARELRAKSGSDVAWRPLLWVQIVFPFFLGFFVRASNMSYFTALSREIDTFYTSPSTSQHCFQHPPHVRPTSLASPTNRG